MEFSLQLTIMWNDGISIDHKSWEKYFRAHFQKEETLFDNIKLVYFLNNYPALFTKLLPPSPPPPFWPHSPPKMETKQITTNLYETRTKAKGHRKSTFSTQPPSINI